MKEVSEITRVDLLKQTISAIDNITEKFYKQEEKEGYRLLNLSLDLFSRVIECLLENTKTDSVSKENQEVIQYLGEVLRAIEAKDAILCADILQYELKERFQTILTSETDSN